VVAPTEAGVSNRTIAPNRAARRLQLPLARAPRTFRPSRFASASRELRISRRCRRAPRHVPLSSTRQRRVAARCRRLQSAPV